MYDLVFKAARTVVDGVLVDTDVGVRSGSIERIGSIETDGAGVEILCNGRLLMPGAIDLHAHLREPGGTHKEDIASGSNAAVRSGVTTILEMPNTNPPTTTVSSLIEKTAIAERTARCHVLFFMALTARNIDELEKAVELPGFAGVKVYLGSTTGNILLSNVDPLERALSRVPALFAFHAELESVLQTRREAVPDPDASSHHVLRPPEAVIEGTRLVLQYASRPELRLHLCHLSTAGELAELSSSQSRAQVSCEVSPHHLWFTHQDTSRIGNRLKVNPPVQGPDDREALRAALVNGLIQAVATDHAPHTLDEKERPYRKAPSGVPGLEVLGPAVLRLVQQDTLSVPRAFEVLCEAPARIAGLRNKGLIKEGYDADLALWDLNRTREVTRGDILSRCGWSPFEGETLAARPDGVWVMGERRV